MEFNKHCVLCNCSYSIWFTGRYIAMQKNRSEAEGFWLGVLFSALGIIIVALLPTKEEKSTIYE